MFKLIAQTAAILALAFGLGIWSVHAMMETARRPGSITVGAWTAYPVAGTPQADPYTKAHIARNGELPLGAGEGIAFTATRDSTGALLSGLCSYVIEGPIPAARLWTLHSKTAQGLSPQVPNLPSSLHSRRMIYRADGTVRIAVSGRAEPGNWLHVPDKGVFSLIFVFYDTEIASGTRAREAELPQVLKAGCDG